MQFSHMTAIYICFACLVFHWKCNNLLYSEIELNIKISNTRERDTRIHSENFFFKYGLHKTHNYLLIQSVVFRVVHWEGQQGMVMGFFWSDWCCIWTGGSWVFFWVWCVFFSMAAASVCMLGVMSVILQIWVRDVFFLFLRCLVEGIGKLVDM